MKNRFFNLKLVCMMIVLFALIIFQVQIEFWGNGDIVEVAGSFNGWHHRIKLDPQPSTSAVDIGESRL